MAAVLKQPIEALRPLRSNDTLSIDRRIHAYLANARSPSRPMIETLRGLVAAGLDRIPLPGHGATLKRWQALERVARHDLSLVKLYESHVDALAILHEIDGRHVTSSGLIHAVWASEARDDPIVIRPTSNDLQAPFQVRIDGRKRWCSGASLVDIALMTAVDAEGRRRLVEVDLASPGIRIDADPWQAVGMAGSGSFDVICDDVPARVVGPANAYLDRSGFWQGGAGVGACWYGAAAAIGTRVRDLQRGRDDAHALAHLGTIDAALASGAALLHECAAAIDAAPERDAMRIAIRVRGAIADMAERVIHEAGRAVGPGPMCNEPALARLVADLPIFIRQFRAEHDLVAQSRSLLADGPELAASGWLL